MRFCYLYSVHGISMLVIHRFWLIFRRNLIQFVEVEHCQCIFLIQSDLNIYVKGGK